MTAAFDAADEGMLFIDEAYTLVRGGENDFGREAIDQIVKLIEDRRDRVVLVVAGYPGEMDAFLAPTPACVPAAHGDRVPRLRRRVVIVQKLRRPAALPPHPRRCPKRCGLLDAVPRSKGSATHGLARNVFEAAINRHAARVIALDGSRRGRTQHPRGR